MIFSTFKMEKDMILCFLVHNNAYFRLDLVNVTEFQEDRNLQVEVKIDIDMNSDTNRTA